MAIIADFHLHSIFSDDCSTPMEDMVKQSIELGLKYICFTDHLDYDFPKKYGNIFEFNIPNYYNEINRLKEKYESKINIYTGIELGIKEEVIERLDTLLAFNKFDFVLNSTHLVSNFDPYYLEFWKDKTEKEGYCKYFDTYYSNICLFPKCDAHAHLDYIVRYGANKNKNYSYIDYKEYIDRILDYTIAAKKMLEINTAGFKYGLKNPHPHIDILEAFYKKGGRLITIGSDAHSPEHIAYKFDETCKILKDIGFKNYYIFADRKPIELEL